MKHNWSGWPGAWCLNCGIEDPIERALADDCQECHLPSGPEDPEQEMSVCTEHQAGECPGPVDAHNPYRGNGMNVYVVIDRSGSMASMRDDAIGGFNTFLENAVQQGDQKVWLWLFDSQGIDLLCDGVPAADVDPLTEKTYIPRSMTPLYDAVGEAIAKGRESDSDKNALVVLTDGQENNSKEWNSEQVRDALKAFEADNWQIVFIAADPDAWAEARTFDGLGTTVRSQGGGANLAQTYTAAAGSLNAYAQSGAQVKGELLVDLDSSEG